MNARIVTLTMNPALDLSSTTERIMPEHKMRCTAPRYDTGGGGVNVSRALRNLGGESTAIYPLGGATGSQYQALAEAQGLDSRVVPIAGNTRESIAVTDTTTGQQYRFVLPGPQLSEREWRSCVDAAASAVSHGGYLVASGSLPPGVPDDLYAQLARIATEAGARTVVDASGPALQHAVDAGVFLIKPSRREFAHLVGGSLQMSDDEQISRGMDLVRSGSVEVIALTLGAAGAVLITAEGPLRQGGVSVDVVSTVGSGDAFLAGMVLRLAQGRPLADAFRTANAAGSATAMLEGTALCRAEDVARLELVA